MESFVIARNSKYKPSSKGSTEQDLLSGLLSTLSLLNNHNNGTFINPVQNENAIPILETFKILAGISGIFMCLALCIIATTSTEYMRRSFYNIFWYSHQIFGALFFILFCVHGIQGVVRKQSNTNRHDPQKCYLVYSDWPINTPDRICDIPQFNGSMATSWIWVLVPIIIYLVERLVRFIRGLRQHRILKYVKHPSNVLELQIENSIKSSRIRYRAGQYIYLNINKISFLEWHPFTITSAPDDSYLSVHIRCVGDWTNQIDKQITDENLRKSIMISIDGPYGSCAEDIFKYETVILIGAGIGKILFRKKILFIS